MADVISSSMGFNEKNSWGTDQRVFDTLNEEFNFCLDACASRLNTKVKDCFLTKEDDALSICWVNKIKECNKAMKTAWINPPYSRGMINKFIKKSALEAKKGLTVVMLIPSTLDAGWLDLEMVAEMRIVTKGRLSFSNPVSGEISLGATKGSMFLVFKPEKCKTAIKLIERKDLLSDQREGGKSG